MRKIDKEWDLFRRIGRTWEIIDDSEKEYEGMTKVKKFPFGDDWEGLEGM